MKDSLEKIPNYKIQLANEIISFWYNVSQEQWFYIGLFLPPIFLVIMLSITFERSQNTVINSMINIFGKYTLIAIMVLFSVAATSIAHIYFNYPEEFDKYLNNVFEMAENVLSKSVLYSIVGCGLLSIVGYRYTSPLLNKLLIKLTRKSITEYKIPETRDLKKIFNKSMEYDPFPYFESAKEKNAIFLGLNSNKKPILVHRKKWCSSHGTIQGETGAGKGVAASIQLAQ